MTSIRKSLLLCGVALVLTFAGLAWLSRGPDFELQFEREVPSLVSRPELSTLLQNAARWPEWHFHLVRVQAPAILSVGSALRLEMVPPKKEWKRFEIEARVDMADPEGRLAVALDGESRNRLKKLLQDVRWQIDLLPGPEGQGTLIRGTCQARTSGVRGRLLGRLAPRVLMNQIFYPDLERLADPEKRFAKPGASDGRLLPF